MRMFLRLEQEGGMLSAGHALNAIWGIEASKMGVCSGRAARTFCSRVTDPHLSFQRAAMGTSTVTVPIRACTAALLTVTALKSPPSLRQAQLA